MVIMDRELVSIVTPMYKGAAFVAETIESVLKQSYRNWEMIIVDDCSPDGGAGVKVVEDYARKDSRIKLIASRQNKGSSGARNIAIERAEGKYIAFLDSDDLWHKDFLREQLIFMAEKQAVLVFSSYRRVDELTKEEILKPFIVPGKVTHRSLLRTCPIFPSTAVYDRTKIGKRYFNEKMGSLRDDYVYWLDMLRNDVVCAYGNPKVLVDYRLRKTSVTANKKKVIKPQWLVLRKIERLSFFKACYYLGCWAIISFFKYRR